MKPQKLIQPIELVISAIHSLRERKGSSAKEILKYLEKKYDVYAETFKREVEVGLRRGVSFGLISQKGGLYQLNEILRSPLRESNVKLKKSDKVKTRKKSVGLRKLKLGKLAKKIGRGSYMLQNRKKKVKGSKAKRMVKSKKAMKTRNSRRPTDIKRRQFKVNRQRQKSKTRKTQKFLKPRKTKAEIQPETDSLKNEANGKVQSCD